MPNQRRRI
jgi:hypothetical protein